MSKVRFVFDRILDASGLLGAVLLLFMVLSVSYLVILRYFLHLGVKWVIDISSYSLLAIAVLGAAWLLRSEGHVAITFIYDRLNPKAQTVINIITSIMGVIISLGLIWFGAKLTYELIQRDISIVGGITVPKFSIIMIIPIGAFLLFIQFLRRTYGYLGREDR